MPQDTTAAFVTTFSEMQFATKSQGPYIATFLATGVQSAAWRRLGLLAPLAAGRPGPAVPRTSSWALRLTEKTC